MIGRFLEVSLRAPRILESWQFYQRLGFASATVGEIWAHRYAVVTDGRLRLGLHDAPFDGPLLSYVLPDLAKHLASLEADGVEFESRVLGNDAFNEARFVAPDGQHVRLVEARTFSPPARAELSILGWFEEYAIPVTDLARSRSYWEKLGFVAASERSEPWHSISLTSDTFDLGLHLTRELSAPTLVFSADDLKLVRQRLAEIGAEPAGRLPRALDPATHLMLVAPEGTQLLVAPPLL
ncbi:MAG TPA: VOC family protein [Steroidobacteraceae bacterium]|nr:VOC family protein [Steroidobacteraceae bacterium]